ncbi:carboxymethylenebutenolidase [Bacillus sp. AFS076308]|uniref:dienelactone hydrolase family protein n=1 Tax=unclassified Bacillus (in: firmicutes) TaxID=185979 RepID=UPI000BF6A394|nr:MULTISPECIES: dienelactone hydrolase family protein [unclassified Bacillus (in: firmicutes)]PFN77620.1 carboxymethylenebutenolidase [Bacillus sp. AFS076308]PGV45299.1 carboxymethylenebutenolidase [Bacillus sp. AFS037270]
MPVETNWVRYGKNQEYIGYMAKMDRVNENLPAVIVIQEIWGVDAHIRNITERFAQAGYLAFAPDLYAENAERMEDLKEERVVEVRSFLDTLPHTFWNNPDEREQAIRELEEGKQNRVTKTFEKMFGGIQSSVYIENLLAATSFLRKECEASKGQGVVSIGFCMGGALSGLLACRDPQLKGAAIFYGTAPSDEELNNINCPLYGFYGELDKRISDNVPALADQMKSNQKSFDYQIYQDTHHAFFNDTRSSYNVSAARDAYQKVLQFFNNVLVKE